MIYDALMYVKDELIYQKIYQFFSWIAIDYDGQPKTRKGLKPYKNQGLSYDGGQPLII